MLLFPFSIAEIDDPERIRVVLHVNGKIGHVPLNALLNQMRQNMNNFDKKYSANAKKIVQKLDDLEQKFKILLQDFENIKKKIGEG
ncbi:hypothetical protein [Bartonella sp. CB189]|uniref:hypothetical protein n=1 Tax=Bartonella sp. CB189 TaxID=3112254 RepID=UPI002F96DF6B